MDDKTQDSKKTVVAFIAGLIIGGLLVWLFSGSSDGTSSEKTASGKKDVASALEEKLGDTIEEMGGAGTTTEKNAPSDEAFSVADQSAGMTVSLGVSLQYPRKEGWIVVHEDVGGELGSALGAARYNTEVELTPASVELLRETEVGKTYHVVYYTEDGDRMFDLKLDTPILKDGGGLLEATFVAK